MTEFSTNLDSFAAFPSSAVGINLLTGDTGWFKVSKYRAASVQVVIPGGVSAGAYIFEQSNDGVNATPWAVCEPHLGVPIITAQTATQNTARIFFGEISSKFVRVRISTAVVGGAIYVAGGVTAGPAFAGLMYAAIVSQPVTTAFPGLPTTLSFAALATTNLTSVKTSGGQLFSIIASNIGASVRFLKLYNKASAPVLATDVPVLTIALTPNGVPVTVLLGELGQRFLTGIAFAITTLAADTDATVVSAAGEVKVNINYV